LLLARRGDKSRGSIVHVDILIIALVVTALVTILLVLDNLKVLRNLSSTFLESPLDSLKTNKVALDGLFPELHNLFGDRDFALVLDVEIELVLHDLQQDGFDVKFIGIGALDKQITDGTGEPVALCGTVLASPAAGDGNGEGRPEAQGVPDAEVEFGLDCFCALLAAEVKLELRRLCIPWSAMIVLWYQVCNDGIIISRQGNFELGPGLLQVSEFWRRLVVDPGDGEGRHQRHDRRCAEGFISAV